MVLVKRFLLPRPAPPAHPQAAQIKPGTKVQLDGVNRADNSQTLVLALSDACRFRAEGAEFYRRLGRSRGATKEFHFFRSRSKNLDGTIPPAVAFQARTEARAGGCSIPEPV